MIHVPSFPTKKKHYQLSKQKERKVLSMSLFGYWFKIIELESRPNHFMTEKYYRLAGNDKPLRIADQPFKAKKQQTNALSVVETERTKKKSSNHGAFRANDAQVCSEREPPKTKKEII